MTSATPDHFTINGLAISLDQIAAFAPIVSLHPSEPYLPCSIEHLLDGAILRKNSTGEIVNDRPQPDDLFTHFGEDFRVEIAPRQFGGQSLAPDGSVAAPMYVSVQVPDDRSFVDLNFQFLHAYNGSQCARVHVPGRDYNCTLEAFAEHQGDIEGMSVRVDPSFRRVLFVRCESHGDSVFYRPEEFDFEGTHPLVCCALHSHASYNGRARQPATDDWFVVEGKSYVAYGFGAAFIDIVRRKGVEWRPFAVDSAGRALAAGRLRFIGLDRAGEPVGAERWAKFRGRLGKHERQRYTGQSGVGGPLTAEQIAFISTVASAVVQLNILPEEMQWGDGPIGFGPRALIHTDKPCWTFPPPDRPAGAGIAARDSSGAIPAAR